MSKRFHSVLTCLVILLINIIYTSPQIPQSTQNGDIYMKKLTCKSFGVNNNQEILVNKAHFEEIKMDELASINVNTNELVTPLIKTNNKESTLYINSQIKVNGHITYESSEEDNQDSSFIELNDIYINNIKQWKSINLIDEKTQFLSEINKNLNKFICGKENNKYEINFDLNTGLQNEADHYKIEMSFNYNKKWTETAYIKINDEFYWVDNHLDNEFSVPVNIIIPSRIIDDDGTLHLTFGIQKLENIICSDDEEVIKFDSFNLLIK